MVRALDEAVSFEPVAVVMRPSLEGESLRCSSLKASARASD